MNNNKGSQIISILALGITSTLLISCSFEQKKEPKKPNIIYILADDLGYGDLSIYGQENFSTPNIDRLAEEGMYFTQHYSGSTVCAPSRSVLLTGQHTGHTPIRGNKQYGHLLNWPLEDEAVTIAEVLKESGYKTACYGKWGLGFNEMSAPSDQGFDEFYGFYNQRIAHHYYPYYIWHNEERIYFEENAEDKTGLYVPEYMQDRLIEFIESNKDSSFFIYYANIIPHAEMFAPEEYMEKFRGKFLPEVDYKGTDYGGKRFREGPYGSQPESHAAFAAMVTYLDDQVGEIYATLKRLGLDKNTIIMFTSDNGPHQEGGADPDYFDSNGPLRGYKRDLYEGGIRVPMIAWFPGQIEAGSSTDHISAFWDILPTFADIAGTETPDNIDGISFLPTLLGKKGQREHDYMYWEFHERGGSVAIRKGDWKLVVRNTLREGQKKMELYKLKDDISEQNDLSNDYPEIVTELYDLIGKSRTDSEDFPFEY
jgi:arylsulfatase A-like enzyme